MKIALIVDPQYDFFDDNGTLKVEGGKKAVENIIQRLKSMDYNAVFVTADFHPFNHCSFKEHGGIWPRHCVAYTQGATIPVELIEAIYTKSVKYVDIIAKGTDVEVEEYSFLQSIGGKGRFFTPLFCEGLIECENNKIVVLDDSNFNIDVMGIAGDICVLNTIEDLVNEGLSEHLTVVENCVASIDDGNTLKNYCEQNNIKMI